MATKLLPRGKRIRPAGKMIPIKFTKPERKAIKRQVLFIRRDVRAGGWTPHYNSIQAYGKRDDAFQTRINKAHAILNRYHGDLGTVVDLTCGSHLPLSRRPVIARLVLNGRSYRKIF